MPEIAPGSLLSDPCADELEAGLDPGLAVDSNDPVATADAPERPSEVVA